MTGKILDIAMATLGGAALVLIIMNASNFATATGAVFSGWDNTLGILSGSGYKRG